MLIDVMPLAPLTRAPPTHCNATARKAPKCGPFPFATNKLKTLRRAGFSTFLFSCEEKYLELEIPSLPIKKKLASKLLPSQYW